MRKLQGVELHVRCNERTKKCLDEAAEYEGMSVAELVRRILREWIVNRTSTKSGAT